MLLLLRWATRSPPHQSPPVTASPQGEASGLCSPTRKSAPNQGTYMGHETAQLPPRCAPPRQNERASSERAIKTGGPGGLPPALFPPVSREKRGPPPGRRPTGRCAPRHRKSPDHPKGTQYCLGPGREPTWQVLTCDGPEGTTCRPPTAESLVISPGRDRTSGTPSPAPPRGWGGPAPAAGRRSAGGTPPRRRRPPGASGRRGRGS